MVFIVARFYQVQQQESVKLVLEQMYEGTVTAVHLNST